MDQDSAYFVRAVVFYDREWWVAQCLEHDLCTSSKKREELPRKLIAQLRTQIAADSLRGKRPFEDLPKAPEKFWRLYKKGVPLPLLWQEGWLGLLLGKLRRTPELRAELALILP
ncbi:MAG TPA: hypothetical protein VF756_28525 [Thermoanaerobaculia bacterium]